MRIIPKGICPKVIGCKKQSVRAHNRKFPFKIKMQYQEDENCSAVLIKSVIHINS